MLVKKDYLNFALMYQVNKGIIMYTISSCIRLEDENSCQTFVVSGFMNEKESLMCEWTSDQSNIIVD